MADVAPWDEKRVLFGVAAALLIDAAKHKHVPRSLWDDMATAVAETRAAVQRRAPGDWPELSSAGDDLTPPIAWGLMWLAAWAQTAPGGVPEPARDEVAKAAIRACRAVAAALASWRAGGPPAYCDMRVSRRLDALDRALRAIGGPLTLLDAGTRPAPRDAT